MEQLFCKIVGRLRIFYYSILEVISKEVKGEFTSVRVDVIIPAIEKNIKTLHLCLEGIRKCIKNPISNIYIVAPCTNVMVNFCERESVILIDEKTVLGYSAKDINFVTSEGSDRSGWIFQQLIKLAGTIGEEEHYVVCDADHVLIRDHGFVTNEKKSVFYQSKEFHIEYYLNMRKLLKLNTFSLLSYVAHKMVFNKEILGKMKKEIELKQEKPWDIAICKNLNTQDSSPFSEFELYGNYLSSKNKLKALWGNKNLSDDEIQDYILLKNKYKSKYKAITFPGYI